jgi:hypothetical protein
MLWNLPTPAGGGFSTESLSPSCLTIETAANLLKKRLNDACFGENFPDAVFVNHSGRIKIQTL